MPADGRAVQLQFRLPGLALERVPHGPHRPARALPLRLPLRRRRQPRRALPVQGLRPGTSRLALQASRLTAGRGAGVLVKRRGSRRPLEAGTSFGIHRAADIDHTRVGSISAASKVVGAFRPETASPLEASPSFQSPIPVSGASVYRGVLRGSLAALQANVAKRRKCNPVIARRSRAPHCTARFARGASIRLEGGQAPLTPTQQSQAAKQAATRPLCGRAARARCGCASGSSRPCAGACGPRARPGCGSCGPRWWRGGGRWRRGARCA